MIVLLETVHPEAHALLGEVDEVAIVSEPPVMDPSLGPAGVRAIVTRGRGQITAELLAAYPDLEVVARCGAGLDNIDTAAAAALGVSVAHAPGSTTSAVSEHALMLMLALSRRLVVLAGAVKASDWAYRERGYEGLEMRGKRMGVIGLGAIGTRVGQLGSALGMEVVHWSRSRRDSAFPQVDLDELLATSDVIQVCVALTPETSGMIGEAELAAMKPTALLVNTARGPVVDHIALSAALADGALGGYGADVWDPEPPDRGSKALADDRVIITPHVAGLTDVTYREICVRPCAAVAALLVGGDPDPSCIFNPGAG